MFPTQTWVIPAEWLVSAQLLCCAFSRSRAFSTEGVPAGTVSAVLSVSLKQVAL